ncbi:MAG TPA: hypothetical protein VFB28_12960 [Terriglobales bacterium]|nr:hypothetical protein [Terriglobales bacterium]
MTDDGLGDWRIDSVSTLAQSFGDAPIGSPIRLMSTAKHKKHKFLSFVTPSAPALCLNVAIGAAAHAEVIRPRLLLAGMVTHDGKRGLQVRDESISDLYYFFEQSIISVTMSFQAVEIFANAIIARKATANVVVKRKGGVERILAPSEAERELSTEEKLAQVLPAILSVSSPRGNRPWHSFRTLKGARDATVHLKSRDIYTRNDVGRESLFFYYLNHNAREYPAAAIKVISHFFPKQLPRWLRYAKQILDSDSRIASVPATL